MTDRTQGLIAVSDYGVWLDLYWQIEPSMSPM